MSPALAAEISQLSTQEKLALIEEVWSMLDREAPPAPAIVAELDRRWAEHVRNPDAALTLDELMKRVEGKRR